MKMKIRKVVPAGTGYAILAAPSLNKVPPLVDKVIQYVIEGNGPGIGTSSLSPDAAVRHRGPFRCQL
jgi:hypothetical protein